MPCLLFLGDEQGDAIYYVCENLLVEMNPWRSRFLLDCNNAASLQAHVSVDVSVEKLQLQQQ